NPAPMKTLQMNVPLRKAMSAALIALLPALCAGSAHPALAEGSADRAMQAATGGSKAASAIETALSRQAEPDFLPPDEGFHFNAVADGPDKIRLMWGVTEGYYLYRSRIKASSDGAQARLGELTLPSGETKTDEYFGKQEVYHHDFTGSIPVARAGAGDVTV